MSFMICHFICRFGQFTGKSFSFR